MALQLALTNSIVNYTSLNLSDSSGEYDVSTNPTGWGAPNLDIASVLYAHIIVTVPNGTDYDIDIDSDLGIDFSTAAYSDLIYNIPSSMLGQTADSLIEDGIYNIEYRISDSATWDDGGNDYSVTAIVMTYYEIQEDVYDRIKLLPEKYQCSCCGNQFLEETSKIFMFLQALIASTQYSNTTRYSDLLSLLEDLIAFETENCADCGC